MPVITITATSSSGSFSYMESAYVLDGVNATYSNGYNSSKSMTLTFPGNNIPANATINKVTVSGVFKRSGSGTTKISMVPSFGATSGDKTLSTDYQTFTTDYTNITLDQINNGFTVVVYTIRTNLLYSSVTYLDCCNVTVDYTEATSGIKNIKIGSSTASSIYLGSTEIQSIYLGNTQIYSK